jgi:4-amino-4-deoxy-L-arabinose transferase-like glycosyltransferase
MPAPAAAPAAVRAGVRAVPGAAWICVLIAVLNGVVWSLLVPPLQSFDETLHVYYGQYLAETGETPRPVEGSVLSDEEQLIVYGVRLFDVVGNAGGRPPWTSLEDVRLDQELARGAGRVSDGGSGGVGLYPPAYYGLGAVAYRLTPTDSLLDRIWAMRLVSALLAGIAVLCCFLFLRELLPRHPWTWTVGALAVGLQPLFGFMSGVFNPDMGLVAASAACFWLLARAFRRGLGTWLALAIGAVLAVGVLAKLAMVGLVPGVALGGLLLARRDRTWRPLVAGAASFTLPMVLYAIANVTVWNRPALPFGGGGGVAAAGGGTPTPRGNWREMLVYIWQDFLPRLPFMQDRFTDFPLWDRWITGWTGRFGWGDYEFPEWVSGVVVAVVVVLAAALVAWVLRGRRAAFAARWREWLCYLAMAFGLLALLAYTGYVYTRDTGNGFEQGRYLLPLMPLYALLVAAGARALGRLGPVAGALIVALCVGWSGWAMILTVGRFYT